MHIGTHHTQTHTDTQARLNYLHLAVSGTTNHEAPRPNRLRSPWQQRGETGPVTHRQPCARAISSDRSLLLPEPQLGQNKNTFQKPPDADSALRLTSRTAQTPTRTGTDAKCSVRAEPLGRTVSRVVTLQTLLPWGSCRTPVYFPAVRNLLSVTQDLPLAISVSVGFPALGVRGTREIIQTIIWAGSGAFQAPDANQLV